MPRVAEGFYPVGRHPYRLSVIWPEQLYASAEHGDLRPLGGCAYNFLEPIPVWRHVIVRENNDVLEHAFSQRLVERAILSWPCFPEQNNRQSMSVFLYKFGCVVGRVVVDNHDAAIDSGSIYSHERLQGLPQDFRPVIGGEENAYPWQISSHGRVYSQAQSEGALAQKQGCQWESTEFESGTPSPHIS